MAVAPPTLPFYETYCFHPQVSPLSASPSLMVSESGALSLGSSPSAAAALQSIFSYGDMGSQNPWDQHTSFFNLSNPGSDLPGYSSEQESADLLLFNNDPEYLLQINGCTPVMHPNLVSTLKNMVAPGPGGGSPRGGSLDGFDQLIQQHDVTHQSDNIINNNNNNNNNNLNNGGAFFVHCYGSMSPDSSSQLSQGSRDGAKSVISSVAASETSAISQPCNITSIHQQPLKVKFIFLFSEAFTLDWRVVDVLLSVVGLLMESAHDSDFCMHFRFK